MPKSIANNMRCLVKDLLGPKGTDNLADLATESNIDTANTSTATTNGDQPRRGEINNAKIDRAIELFDPYRHHPSEKTCS